MIIKVQLYNGDRAYLSARNIAAIEVCREADYITDCTSVYYVGSDQPFIVSEPVDDLFERWNCALLLKDQ